MLFPYSTKETETDFEQKSLVDSNDSHIENFIQVGIDIQKCNSCDKSFSSGQFLKNHIKNVHEENKMFKCESCEKSYARSNHLRSHIRFCKGSKNKIINKGDNSIDNDFLIEQAKKNKAILKLERIEYSSLASEWIPLATLKSLKSVLHSKSKSPKKCLF